MCAVTRGLVPDGMANFHCPVLKIQMQWKDLLCRLLCASHYIFENIWGNDFRSVSAEGKFFSTLINFHPQADAGLQWLDLLQKRLYSLTLKQYFHLSIVESRGHLSYRFSYLSAKCEFKETFIQYCNIQPAKSRDHIHPPRCTA